MEQLGKFCCNDGVCIDSEFVCDKISHCGESEDEIKDLCRVVTFDEHNYRSEESPVAVENIDGETVSSLTQINMTISISNFISLDINEAHFTIIYRKVITIYWDLVSTRRIHDFTLFF